jgi:2-oxoglutarate ferredoxin oxidoreductase subunit alpha
LIIAYGSVARICQTAIDQLEEEGISVGLFRPITLYPFPEKQIYDEVSKKNVKNILVVEMSTGQMYEDVERAVKGKKKLKFYGRTGGIVPSPEEVMEQLKKLVGIKSKKN